MLNPLEQEVLEICERLMGRLAVGKITAVQYRDEVMGPLRRVVIMLTNKKYGCIAGRHSYACHCK